MEEIKEKQKDPADPGKNLTGSGNNNRAWEILKILFMVTLVCSLGLFAVNQFMQYRYNVFFIKKPCGLCAELNPDIKSCIEGMAVRPSYPLGDGRWSDPFNDTPQYRINITN